MIKSLNERKELDGLENNTNYELSRNDEDANESQNADFLSKSDYG